MSNDPMSIIYSGGGIEILTSSDIRGLASVLRSATVVACVLAMAISFISMIFANNPQNVTENKKDVVNKLFIIFIVSSMVTIFNVLIELFNSGI